MFSSLTIIDASTVLAGPSVATFFAELGATVIKVENTKVPDVTRTWKLPSENPDSVVSAYFSSVNYKKKYKSLNLADESDRQEFYNLVSQATILISNFKHGDEEKLKIEDERLRKINSRLIIGKINGFGSESDRVAYDLILQAETGFMSMNGTAESGPVKMPVALIDVLASHHLKEGLLLALMELEKSEVARTVSVSLYDAAVCSLVNQASNYLMSGKIPDRIGSLHPNIAPYGEIFKTLDNEQITLAIGSDQHFNKLCKALNLSSLSSDKRFLSNQARVINRNSLFRLLQERISLLDTIWLFEKLLQDKLPPGKINNLSQVFGEKVSKRLIRTEEIEGVITKRVTSIAFQMI